MKWGNRGGCVLLVLLLIFSFWLVLEEGEAMSGIGLPDWGRIKKDVGVSPLADLGELAARLGSINTFDRRGDTVWMDDFESGLNKWQTYAGYPGGSVAVSAERARNGGYACKLVTGTNGAGTAFLFRALPYPVLGRIGLEFSFAMDDDISYVDVIFYLYDGTRMLLPHVQYDKVSGVLKYMSADVVWITLASDLFHTRGTTCFWTMKMVADFVKNEYVRIIFNERVFDLAGQALQIGESTATPTLYPYIEVAGQAGVSGIAFIDDVIITQNEP